MTKHYIPHSFLSSGVCVCVCVPVAGESCGERWEVRKEANSWQDISWLRMARFSSDR